MARPSSDVDPRNMEVRDRKRKRKYRRKPEPHPLNLAQKETARQRLRAMPANPGVIYEPRDGGGWTITSPHSDFDLWEVQMASAFGSNSTSVRRIFLRELKHLCRQDWDEAAGWKPNETELNAILAMVNDVQPRNTLEAGLAAQMVAVHLMQLRLSRDALNGGGIVMEKSAALASKLARTYADQLDILRKLRGGKPETVRQEIHVTKETHVNYHDHRGASDIRGQSDAKVKEDTTDATTGGLADMQKVSCANEDGQVVPITRRKGKEGM